MLRPVPLYSSPSSSVSLSVSPLLAFRLPPPPLFRHEHYVEEHTEDV